jgi:hypothetical protein
MSPNVYTVVLIESPVWKAIRIAKTRGWRLDPPELGSNPEMLALHLAIDSRFWQALGRSQRWGNWQTHREMFILHLESGKDMDSFFRAALK